MLTQQQSHWILLLNSQKPKQKTWIVLLVSMCFLHFTLLQPGCTVGCGTNFLENNFGRTLTEKWENSGQRWEVLQSLLGWSCDPSHGINHSSSGGTVLQHTRARWWCGHGSPAPCSHHPVPLGSPDSPCTDTCTGLGGAGTSLCSPWSQLPALPCTFTLRINGDITSSSIVPSRATH